MQLLTHVDVGAGHWHGVGPVQGSAVHEGGRRTTVERMALFMLAHPADSNATTAALEVVLCSLLPPPT